MIRKLLPLTALLTAGPALVGLSRAAVIAGVDFELATDNTMYDQVPDDLDTGDQITVSDWSFTILSNGNVTGNSLRNDGGATGAGATTPNFPSRLEGGRTGFFSLIIPDGVVLNLENVRFDVRGATGGTGRDGEFLTSLDGGTPLWSDFNLNGRTSGDWQPTTVDLSGATYQGLTDTTIDFIWRTPSGAIDLDTIVINGTVIPEPSTAGLLGLGLFLLGRRRR